MGGYTCEGDCCASSGGYTIVTTRQEQISWTAGSERRVAPCDGVKSPIKIMFWSDDERGIARAGVLRKRSCRVRVCGRHESKT